MTTASIPWHRWVWRTPMAEHTGRGFPVYASIPFQQYEGEAEETLRVQESSLSTERRVWVGAHSGYRMHLNEDVAAQLRDALTEFLEDTPERRAERTGTKALDRLHREAGILEHYRVNLEKIFSDEGYMSGDGDLIRIDALNHNMERAIDGMKEAMEAIAGLLSLTKESNE